MPYHSSKCIPWLVVLITECLAIVILNIITIIVFVKKRQLQRRSTYLIIHLAVVDLLAGAVSGPLQIEQGISLFCNLWKFDWSLNWSYHVKLALRNLFSQYYLDSESDCYIIRTTTRNILSIQASFRKKMGL